LHADIVAFECRNASAHNDAVLEQERTDLADQRGALINECKRKRIGPFQRVPLPKPTAANQSWSMDFVADGLGDGRRLRCLTIVDDHSRECPAIEVDASITGTRVVAVLERLADNRGLPASITVDHGPEFEGQVLEAWAYSRGVRLSFIRPSKPVENAYRELQRQVPRRVLERALVRQPGARATRDRELENRIQH
jgi:transposase InsO family protein